MDIPDDEDARLAEAWQRKMNPQPSSTWKMDFVEENNLRCAFRLNERS